MTVAELIDELQQCEPEWRVKIDDVDIVDVQVRATDMGTDYVKLLKEGDWF